MLHGTVPLLNASKDLVLPSALKGAFEAARIGQGERTGVGPDALSTTTLTVSETQLSTITKRRHKL